MSGFGYGSRYGLLGTRDPSAVAFAAFVQGLVVVATPTFATIACTLGPDVSRASGWGTIPAPCCSSTSAYPTIIRVRDP